MRGLATVLEGQVIRAAEMRRPDLRWPMPPHLVATLTGAHVQGFRRRGKYMLMRLRDRDSVLIHLGMSGRMVARHRDLPALPRTGPQGAVSDARGHNAPPEAHEHLMLETEGGWRVGFVDPRRFGSVDLVPRAAEDGHKLLAGLGPEPLEAGFTAAVLEAALAGRFTPIKAALLDQKTVAGLGNIYVCEALFRAGISPRRPSATIPGARALRLHVAIQAVLRDAIEAGGSSLRDYVRADGELGHFQDRFDVYDREGTPCRDCPGPPRCPGVARVVQSGRSTFYCPTNQR